MTKDELVLGILEKENK